MNEETEYQTSHIIGIRYMTEDFIQSILDDASEIKKNPSKYAGNLKGKILSLAFWEASTRTRLSFESAMLRLGGKTLGFSSQAGTSIEKGESLSDTITMLAGYSLSLFSKRGRVVSSPGAPAL